jgi:hypothetical protein
MWQYSDMGTSRELRADMVAAQHQRAIVIEQPTNINSHRRNEPDNVPEAIVA